MNLEGLRGESPVPYAVRHDLNLSLTDVVLIADRHTGACEQHLAELPLLLPSGRRTKVSSPPAETLSNLQEADAWVTLFGVQQDPLMRETAGYLRSLIGSEVELVLSLICSSSRGITPAHMDVYDVLLLQLAGRKTLGTGVFTQRKEADEELRRRFGSGRENLQRLPDRRTEWPLEPGLGVVIPAYTPHWATIGDEMSLALSVSMSSPALRRREAIHRADAALVKRHVRLPAPGRSPLVDRARLTLHSTGQRLR